MLQKIYLRTLTLILNRARTWIILFSINIGVFPGVKVNREGDLFEIRDKRKRLKIVDIKRFDKYIYGIDFRLEKLLNEYMVDSVLSEVNVVVEVGANIGEFALGLKGRKPDLKLICIEPAEREYDALRKNLSQYEKVAFINKAVDAKAEKKYFIKRAQAQIRL